MEPQKHVYLSACPLARVNFSYASRFSSLHDGSYVAVYISLLYSSRSFLRPMRSRTFA